MALEAFGDREALPGKARIGALALPAQRCGRGSILGHPQQRLAFTHQVAVGGAGAVPFEHCEFGMVRRAAFVVAIDVRQLPDPRHAARHQLLHGEFGRGMEIARPCAAALRIVQHGREGLEMRFEPGAHLQSRGVDFDIPALGEEIAHRAEDAAARRERGTPRIEAIGPPP